MSLDIEMASLPIRMTERNSSAKFPAVLDPKLFANRIITVGAFVKMKNVYDEVIRYLHP